MIIGLRDLPTQLVHFKERQFTTADNIVQVLLSFIVIDNIILSPEFLNKFVNKLCLKKIFGLICNVYFTCITIVT